jgi:ribosomal protein L7Ae-like RNA K-turn-binding protein
VSGPRDRRALELLGLARRAGAVVVGTQAVRDATRRGRLGVVVIARDAGENARARVLPLVEAAGGAWVECGTAASLGGALGRGRTVVAGVEDRRLARRVRDLAAPDAGEVERRNDERRERRD